MEISGDFMHRKTADFSKRKGTERAFIIIINCFSEQQNYNNYIAKWTEAEDFWSTDSVPETLGCAYLVQPLDILT